LLAALTLALASSTPQFRTVQNLSNILHQSTINTLLAAGVTLTILTGGIDLSVGSLLALTGVGLGLALHAGVPVPLALVIGAALGASLGLISGLVIARGGVPPFIATLGMMLAASGLALWITGSRNVSLFPLSFQAIGAPLRVGELSIPVSFGVALLAVLLGTVFLLKTTAGRYLYAVGGNRAAARLSGIPVARTLALAYALSGASAGLAGAVTAAKLNSASPIAGAGAELDAIAAAVLGGASLAGGRGSLVGALGGALALVVLRNGCNLIGIDPNQQRVLIGALLVAAVLIDMWRRRRDDSAAPED
jgi:ribose/xylose/arabinose/galactoside ABC-type transport system permease subunit